MLFGYSYRLSYGTHSLLTHAKKHERSIGDISPNILDEIKEHLKVQLVNYCAKDLRPFAVVQGNMEMCERN